MPKVELMLTLTRLTVARDLPGGHLHVATCQFTGVANSSSNLLGTPGSRWTCCTYSYSQNIFA